MEKHDNPEFDLDDILQEFADDELPEMPLDIEGAAPLAEEEEEPRDTIRLDQIQKAVNAPSVPEDTIPFAPVAAEPAVEAEEDEPYIKTWEPAYEEAPEEFTRPPIAFRPKNRLRELRQKLVEGPERRYYALSELGTAKLQAALLLHVLLLVVALGGVALYALNLVQPDRIRFLIFSQVLVLLLSGLLGCYRMMEGIGALLRGRFTLKTLLLFTFIACCIDGMRCLSTLQMPGCSVFCLQILIAQLSELNSRNAEMEMMDTLRKATNLHSVVRVEDYHDGKPGYGVGEGRVEDFMENYAKPSAPERALNIFALMSLLAAIGVGIYAGMTVSVDAGVRFGTSVLLAAAPAGAFFSMARPAAVLQKRLHKLGTVLCGWNGIRKERKIAYFPVTHADLFPAGSIKLNGVKYYGTADPDTVVAYTASLIAEDGSGLAELFTQLLESRGGYKFHIEHFRAYANGGIGGELGGESVLVGSLQFMRQLGVEMPKNMKVPNAVYTAIDGTLVGVFALAFSRSKAASAALQSLCGHGKLRPVLVGNDFILTESFLRSKFRARTRRMVFLSREEREALAAKQTPEECHVVGISVREGLAQKGFAVTGGRVLRAALIAGAALHIFAGLVGAVMVAALAYVGAESLIVPQNLLLYSLLWLIPGWLITEWTRQL